MYYEVFVLNDANHNNAGRVKLWLHPFSISNAPKKEDECIANKMAHARAVTIVLSGTTSEKNLENDQQYLLKEFSRSGNLKEFELLARYIFNAQKVHEFFGILQGVLENWNINTDFKEKVRRKFIKVFCYNSWRPVLEEFSANVGFDLGQPPYRDVKRFIRNVRNVNIHKCDDRVKYDAHYNNNSDEKESGTELYKSMRKVAPLVFIKIFKYVRESKDLGLQAQFVVCFAYLQVQ
jgi:hypothetical protein